MPSAPQPTSLELVHLSEAMRLTGYDHARYIGRVQSANGEEDGVSGQKPTNDGDNDDKASRDGMDEATIL